MLNTELKKYTGLALSLLLAPAIAYAHNDAANFINFGLIVAWPLNLLLAALLLRFWKSGPLGFTRWISLTLACALAYPLAYILSILLYSIGVTGYAFLAAIWLLSLAIAALAARLLRRKRAQ